MEWADGMLTLSSPNLADLLEQARQYLRTRGARHTTQRGTTLTANLVALTWQAPHELGQERLPWSAEDAAWYLRVFVDATAQTDPLARVVPGALLFPYTYAARSRYWDGGWAHLVTLLAGLSASGRKVERVRASFAAFQAMVEELAATLHVQTVLSLLALYPASVLSHFAQHPNLVRQTALAWRRDTLLDAVEDIEANPYSRRAVVPSFCYPHLEEQLSPQMGKPAYQMFHFLPGDAGAPIASVHEHRSLDVVGGAQLDFLHDLAWLRLAGERLERPCGDITVIAHNLHEYDGEAATLADEARTYASPIERWLCRVTDGYHAGDETPHILLAEADYHANLERIFARWSGMTQSAMR